MLGNDAFMIWFPKLGGMSFLVKIKQYMYNSLYILIKPCLKEKENYNHSSSA